MCPLPPIAPTSPPKNCGPGCYCTPSIPLNVALCLIEKQVYYMYIHLESCVCTINCNAIFMQTEPC